MMSNAKQNVLSLTLQSDFTALELVYLNINNGAPQIIQAHPANFRGVQGVTKTLDDAAQLTEDLSDLIAQCQIPKGTPVSVVLPSLYTSTITLPSSLTSEELSQALKGEVERNVLFKKVEPAVDWFRLGDEDPDARMIPWLVGAYPEQFVSPLFEALKKVGLKPVAMLNHTSAAIKGLVATRTLVEDGQRRLVCLLAQNTFTMIMLEGLRIQSILEVPVATTSMQVEHVLEDIREDVNSLGDILVGCSQCLLIQNNALLPTEGIVESLSTHFSNVIVVEQNAETLGSLGGLSPSYPCSLEALGGCLSQTLDELPAIDFIPNNVKNQNYLGKVRKDLLKIMIGLNVLVLLGVLVVAGITGIQLGLKEAALAAASAGPPKGAAPTIEMKLEETSQKIWIKRHQEAQAKNLEWLVDLPTHLPSGVWVDKLAADFKKPYTVTLEGGSTASGSVEALVGMIGKPTETAPAFVLAPVTEKTEDVQVPESDKPKKQRYFSWTLKALESETQ